MNDPANKHRILLVDDEEIIRLALKTILTRHGFETDAAADAFEGLALMDQHTYSVVISDHKMPGMSGLEFLAQVKTLCPQTTRILTTVSFNISSHIDEINRAEVFQFIIKPWESETLLETVRRGIKKFETDSRSESLRESSLMTNQALATEALSLEDERAMLHEQIENIKDNWQQTIQINLHTIQTLCPWLGSQTQRVRQLCASIASIRELSPLDRELLDLAAQLYDIGMLSISSELALKWHKHPEKLTQSEWDIIHQHPTVGAQLVQFSPPYDTVSELIQNHHECQDGSGYPNGRTAGEIPPLAKYLGAAVRIHESPKPNREALEELREIPGIIDEDTLDTLEEIFSQQSLELAEAPARQGDFTKVA